MQNIFEHFSTVHLMIYLHSGELLLLFAINSTIIDNINCLNRYTKEKHER